MLEMRVSAAMISASTLLFWIIASIPEVGGRKMNMLSLVMYYGLLTWIQFSFVRISMYGQHYKRNCCNVLCCRYVVSQRSGHVELNSTENHQLTLLLSTQTGCSAFLTVCDSMRNLKNLQNCHMLCHHSI